MPVDTAEIIKLACMLCKDANLRVTVKESIKGGLIAGCGTVVGGILLGPIGLAIGATMGGLAAACNAQSFESAVTVIQRMDRQQQEKLAKSIQTILSQLNITDVVIATQIIMGDAHLQKKIMGVIINYFKNELQIQIAD